MTSSWAISLPAEELVTAGALRLRGSTEACVASANRIWIRGERFDDNLAHVLKTIPAASRFQVLPDGQLIADGNRVPHGRLPEGPWQPLAGLMRVAWPTGILAGQVERKVAWQIVRSQEERPARLLLTTMAEWLTWASTAPQVRLEQLTFALDVNERVLVQGSPLPSIPGNRLWEADGIAVPVGYSWTPAVPASVLRQAWDLPPNDIAVIAEDGSWECVPVQSFVKASRSAVRLSARELATRRLGARSPVDEQSPQPNGSDGC